MNPQRQKPSQPESISVYLASGESETVANAASVNFEKGQMVLRDRDGQALKSVRTSDLAFASRSPDMSGMNVWI